VTDAKDPKLALFELYLATAEKVSDRRAQANAWMLSVNSAIVALYGYLQAEKMAVGAAQKAVWLWAIPAAGAIVCLAWVALLTSYRKLNRAKFAVLMQVPKLPKAPSSVHLLLLDKASWVEPQICPNDDRFDGYPELSIEDWHKKHGLWIE
jgi:hypothetical protein